MKKFLLNTFYILLPVFILAIGLFLSFTQLKLTGGIDKLYHLGGFFFSSVLVSISFYKLINNKWWFFYYIFACCFLGGLAGAIIELLQDYYSTYRLSEVEDWLANVIGIAMGVFVVYLIKVRLERKQEIDGF